MTLLVLYHALATARWGRTAGKAIFELEVVDVATAARPRFRQALRRALSMFGVPMIALWLLIITLDLERDAANRIIGFVMALPMLAGVLLLFYASSRIAGKRAKWDRFAGTMVRYRTTRTAAK